MSHTPGPWHVIEIKEMGRVIDNSIWTESGEWVDLGSPDNARLIAAAPDLLAACEAALTELETLWHYAEVYEQQHYGPDEDVMTCVKAAIAKAKGEADDGK